MGVSHALAEVSAVFDDPNLVSCTGLAPVLALAQRCRLAELVGSELTLTPKGGVNAPVKVPALLAPMVAVMYGCRPPSRWSPTQGRNRAPWLPSCNTV